MAELTLGWQFDLAAGWSERLVEARAFHARHVEGLAIFRRNAQIVTVLGAPPLAAQPAGSY